jgi:hypothetical protein
VARISMPRERAILAWKGGSAEGVMCFISTTKSDGGAARRSLSVLPMRVSGKSGSEKIARLKKDGPPDYPANRFSYRYTAADHAWSAAQLMANDTPELAQLLNEAGTWLKVQNPQAADRFYKALVTRCPTTDLGRKAAELEWFPPVAKSTP